MNGVKYDVGFVTFPTALIALVFRIHLLPFCGGTGKII
jgi:hypothetical protein